MALTQKTKWEKVGLLRSQCSNTLLLKRGQYGLQLNVQPGDSLSIQDLCPQEPTTQKMLLQKTYMVCSGT